MNKLAIFGASAVMAALPVAGVFAAGQSVTDTVVVNIAESCTVDIIGDGEHSTTTSAATLSNGGEVEVTGAQLGITCNDAKGWKLSAIGGDGTTVSTDMVGVDTDNKIPTGTTFDGNTSNWAFKVDNEGIADVNIQGDFGSWSAIPSTADTIVAKSGKAVANNEHTVLISYKVSANATQGADTYTGKVTYTIAHPAGN